MFFLCIIVLCHTLFLNVSPWIPSFRSYNYAKRFFSQLFLATSLKNPTFSSVRKFIGPGVGRYIDKFVLVVIGLVFIGIDIFSTNRIIKLLNWYIESKLNHIILHLVSKILLTTFIRSKEPSSCPSKMSRKLGFLYYPIIVLEIWSLNHFIIIESFIFNIKFFGRGYY